MDALSAHAIIQSVRDTAIRFSESEGRWGWRGTLTEIIHHLPGGGVSALRRRQAGEWGIERPHFDLNQSILQHMRQPTNQYGQSPMVCNDGGDVSDLGSGKNGLKRWNEDSLAVGADEHPSVYVWSVGWTRSGYDDEESIHIIRSRQCAWFLERLRTLCCLPIGYSGPGESGIPENPDFPEALHGTSESFSQSDMTWHTLLKFLMFVLEKSDWTTPLMSDARIGNIGDGPFPTAWVHFSAHRRTINWCHHTILEGSGVPRGSGWDGDNLSLGSLSESDITDMAIHRRFNEEQTETLDFERLDRAERLRVILRMDQTIDEPEPEPEPDPEPEPEVTIETTLEKKKRQLTEILSILEGSAALDEIMEGDYKDYADLLMSCHRTM